MVANVATQYVTAAGSDSADGMSWGSAKATVAAAYTALPSTGGVIQLGYGDFSLGSASVGFTWDKTKPVHFRGLGKELSALTYGGTGVAMLFDGSGTDPNDDFSLRSMSVECTGGGSHAGVKIVSAHRWVIEDTYLLGNSYSSGSRGLWGVSAYGGYVDKSVVAGFDTGIDLDSVCHDTSITDTNIGAATVCVRVEDSTDVRINGGQHSGTGSTIGHMVIATAALGNGCKGFQALNVHFESNGLDSAIGRAGDGSDTNVLNPTLHGPFRSGLTLDRCTHALVFGAYVGDGTARVFTLTANCSYPVVVGLTLAASATISDSSGTPTSISDVNGRTGIGTLAPATNLHVEGEVLIKNNTSLRWKDSGGTSRRIGLLTSGNAAWFGDVDNAMTSGVLNLAAKADVFMLVDGAQVWRANGSGIQAMTGDIQINTAGKGLKIKEGSNAKMGTATLVAGTATVSTTAVTANSRIQLTIQSLGTVSAPKAIGVTARTAGTSFTITSADATDTSVIAWLLVEGF